MTAQTFKNKIMTTQEKIYWFGELSENEQIRLLSFYGYKTKYIMPNEVCKIYDAEHAPKEAPKEYDFITPPHYRIYEGEDKEVWKMMVSIWGEKSVQEHFEMNSFEYRMRLGLKPDQPIERDLEKAKWCENKAKELSKTK